MNTAQKHATGILVIIANVAAALHDELAGHWPANGREWTIFVLAALASLGTASALYGIKPKTSPASPATPANENVPLPPAAHTP